MVYCLIQSCPTNESPKIYYILFPRFTDHYRRGNKKWKQEVLDYSSEIEFLRHERPLHTWTYNSACVFFYKICRRSSHPKFIRLNFISALLSTICMCPRLYLVGIMFADLNHKHRETEIEVVQGFSFLSTLPETKPHLLNFHKRHYQLGSKFSYTIAYKGHFSFKLHKIFLPSSNMHLYKVAFSKLIIIIRY